MKRKSYGCREEVWIFLFKRFCRLDDFDRWLIEKDFLILFSVFFFLVVENIVKFGIRYIVCYGSWKFYLMFM